MKEIFFQKIKVMKFYDAASIESLFIKINNGFKPKIFLIEYIDYILFVIFIYLYLFLSSTFSS